MNRVLQRKEFMSSFITNILPGLILAVAVAEIASGILLFFAKKSWRKWILAAIFALAIAAAALIFWHTRFLSLAPHHLIFAKFAIGCSAGAGIFALAATFFARFRTAINLLITTSGAASLVFATLYLFVF